MLEGRACLKILNARLSTAAFKYFFCERFIYIGIFFIESVFMNLNKLDSVIFIKKFILFLLQLLELDI